MIEKIKDLGQELRHKGPKSFFSFDELNVEGVKMAVPKEVTDEQLAQIKEYIESVKYGSINIIIQDGKIIQMDKNEKIRL